jgi:hypothetical protein
MTPRWRVVRLDDNGNVFVVEDGLDERTARGRAHRFELRAHKQMYWAELVPTDAPPGSG